MVKSNSELVNEYFVENPKSIYGGYGKTANKLGVSYSTVYQIAQKFKKNSAPETQDSTSDTVTSEDGYQNITDVSKTENNSLKNYCDAYGIPYEYVTSAKFVNHTFQEVWNVVCDTTKLTPAYLDKYFDNLKNELSNFVEPVSFDDDKISNKAAYHYYHSDKHVGAMTKSNAIYSNNYNAQVFEDRLMQTLKDYEFEASTRGTFDKVLVADLGDSVDGWNKVTTRFGKGSSHTLPQNLDNCETFDVYVSAMCKFFDKLVDLDLANNIEFVAVTNDNHGGSFSYIVNRGVEIYLNLKYPQIKTTISRDFFVSYSYGDHGFILTHGKDEEHQKFGYPLNLDEKTESKLNQFIRRKNLRKKYMHVIKGDLHQESTNLTESLRYRNVLSLYGPSAWVMANFGFSFGGSSYDIVYKDHQKVLSGYMTFEE